MPQWSRAHGCELKKFSFQIPGSRMSNALVDLLLGQLLGNEPALAERELVSIQDLLNVLILSWRHKVGFGEHANTTRSGFAILDDPESGRCFDILVCACLHR